MTADAFAEEVRSCLPVIAAPIRANEPVPSWLSRAARTAGISVARARAYWYRQVERPRVDEYFAIISAADLSQRRLEDMESAYEADRERFARDFPRLARLLPPSLRAPAPSSGDVEGAAR
ncbi:hypothetical protein AB4Z01_14955 [Inquilinus sp. YAF38]|uniref:hypothetical protein n=1 Tax=Inquilinus sp. YAF38 TaxID=3233084 RepID=UPI003F8E7597